MYSKNIIKSLLASSSILFLGIIDSYLLNLSFTLTIYFLLGRSLKNSSLKQYNILIIFLLPHLLISLIIGYFRLWEIHIFFPQSSIAMLLSLIWANISNSTKLRPSYYMLLHGFILWYTVSLFNFVGSNNILFGATILIYLLVGLYSSRLSHNWRLIFLYFVLPNFFCNFLSWQLINPDLFPFHFPINSIAALISFALGFLIMRKKLSPQSYIPLILIWSLANLSMAFQILPYLQYKANSSEKIVSIPNQILISLTDSTPPSDSLKNKIVYLDFWGTWCGPCIKQFPVLEEIQQKYIDDPRVEIGLISSVKLDEIDRIKQFISKNPYSFIQYYDSAGVWVDHLKIKKVPVGVLLNGKGEIVYRHSGFGGELETQTFKKELINRIESLLISNSSSL